MKGDAKAIFSAASLATRAFDYLYGLQPAANPAASPATQSGDGEPTRPNTDIGTAASATPKGPR